MPFQVLLKRKMAGCWLVGGGNVWQIKFAVYGFCKWLKQWHPDTYCSCSERLSLLIPAMLNHKAFNPEAVMWIHPTFLWLLIVVVVVGDGVLGSHKFLSSWISQSVKMRKREENGWITANYENGWHSANVESKASIILCLQTHLKYKRVKKKMRAKKLEK